MLFRSGEPNLLGGTHSIWWSWAAPKGGSVTVSTVGSSFDTVLGIYTGSAVNALTLVASNDDSGGNGTSLLTFNATSGVVYRIRVDGYSGSFGTIRPNLNQP